MFDILYISHYFHNTKLFSIIFFFFSKSEMGTGGQKQNISDFLSLI